MEHTRAVRPSHMLQLFLLVALAVSAVRLRTLVLMAYPARLLGAASLRVLLAAALLLLESLGKRALFASEQDRRLPPEETMGLFGERLFWYLNGLFRRGYRKILEPGDLGSIDASLTSDGIRTAFRDQWLAQGRRTDRGRIFRVIFRVLWRDLLTPVVPRLLYMGTTISQPFLISAAIRFVQAAPSIQRENTGYGLLAAFALNYVFLAIFSSWYSQSVAKFGVKIRGGLIALIYARTLTVDPEEVDLGSATVLMNVDIEKVHFAVIILHELWALAVVAAVAFYIIHTRLGAVFVAPIVLIAAAVAASSWLGKLSKSRQLDWVRATERRVTAIAHAAGSIRGIRMLGLTRTVYDDLTGLREEEIRLAVGIQKIIAAVAAVSNYIFQVTVYATFLAFALVSLARGEVMDYDKVFASLSALKLVTTPLLITLQQIPTFMAGITSLERIQEYLDGGSLGDPDDSESTPLIERQRSGGRGGEAQSSGIELREISQTSGKAGERPSHNSIIHLEGASFGIKSGEPLLQNIDLDIPRGTLTIVTGKIASGKSVLLRSLIGETRLCSGHACLPSSGTAFCAQSPWLRNASLRANILGFESAGANDAVDEAYYARVTAACALDADFAQLRRGDAASAGSRGTSLSGGQRARVALARALYARRATVVADDVLAGLDGDTEAHVFECVFGPRGLLRRGGATVVLATHSVRWLPYADRVVMLAGGEIVEQGTYAEVSRRETFVEYVGQIRHEGEAGEDKGEGGGKDGGDGKVAPEVKKKDLVEEMEEERAELLDRRDGDIRTLLYYLQSVGRRSVAIDAAGMIASNVATTMQCETGLPAIFNAFLY